MKKIISTQIALLMILSSVVFGPVKTVEAAALTISSPVNASTSPGVTTEVIMSWAIGAQIGGSPVISSSSEVTIKVKSATSSLLISGALLPCTTGTTSMSAGYIRYYDTYGNGTSTLVMASSTLAGGTATSCIKLPALGAGVYSISIYSEGNAYDSLATALYVGTSNQVTVTADVEPSLGFYLYANSCDLGVLSNGAVSSCSYTGSTTSNTAISGGVIVNIKGNSSSLTEPAGGNTIGGNAACGVVTAGTNGLRISATSTSDWSSASTFACAANQGIQAPNGSFSTFLTSASTWSGGEGTFTVQHVAAAGNSTKVGHYTQQITYTVTLQF